MKYRVSEKSLFAWQVREMRCARRKEVLHVQGNIRCCCVLKTESCFISRPKALPILSFVGRSSYGLDGPEIDSRWGARFSTPVQTGLGAHPTSYTMGTGSFYGVKLPGRGVDHPLPSSAEVKERVELYLNSTSGPSWPVIGWTLPLPLPFTHSFTVTSILKSIQTTTGAVRLSAQPDCFRNRTYRRAMFYFHLVKQGTRQSNWNQYKRDKCAYMEAHSSKHCCRWKTISIT